MGVVRQLSGIDLELLLELHCLSGKHGFAFPKREWLAKKFKVSIWTISRHVSKLVRLGLLAIRQCRRRRLDGTWDAGPNLYKLRPWALSILAKLGHLTGVRVGRTQNRNKKKKGIRQAIAFFSPSFEDEKQEISEQNLRKFPLLRTWLERGGKACQNGRTDRTLYN